MHVTTISGSPSAASRSAALLEEAVAQLRAEAASVQHVAVRELPPGALLAADTDAPAIRAAVSKVAAADLVVVATPIYKASFSGLLKAFFDLLPPDALRGRIVLPLATGGSPAHLLALEYALKPVLGALGARHVLDGVFGADAQFTSDAQGRPVPEPALRERLAAALLGVRCRA